MRDILPPSRPGIWPEPAEDVRDRDLPEVDRPDARHDQPDTTPPADEAITDLGDQPEIRWPEEGEDEAR